MAQVIIDNHDFLGKLTIIKNCLSVLLTKIKDQSEKELLDSAAKANQDLIDTVKEAFKNG